MRVARADATLRQPASFATLGETTRHWGDEPVPRLFDLYKKLPSNTKRRLKRGWFELLSKIDTGDDLLFMNHGYADPLHPTRGLDLAAEDERYRYPIQLYHRIAADIDWKGLSGLEIGCGRGGGTAYMQRALGSKSMLGIDITESAIHFCQDQFDVPGLSFKVGDAEALAFPDESFDAVLYVESCLHYADIERFFREVPRLLRGLFTKFAGARGEGDKEIEEFRTGNRVYLRLVLRKPTLADVAVSDPARDHAH